MASLLTSLCRVGGEQIYYRLDQPGYSVLSCLDIDPNAAPARGVGGYGTDAGNPCPQEQPPRLFLAERPEEVLHRRAGCEGNAVHLARPSAPSEDGTDSYAGGTATSAPASRSFSGSISRATSARGMRTFFPAS